MGRAIVAPDDRFRVGRFIGGLRALSRGEVAPLPYRADYPDREGQSPNYGGRR